MIVVVSAPQKFGGIFSARVPALNNNKIMLMFDRAELAAGQPLPGMLYGYDFSDVRTENSIDA